MQIIAGLVEHRLSDYILSYYNEPLIVNTLSFIVRTINSYLGTQVRLIILFVPFFTPRYLTFNFVY